MVSGPRQGYCTQPCTCLYRGACLCPWLGNKQAPGSSTAPGAWHSLLATALPGVAFGHFISLFGLVTHSAQTSGKKKGSIKSKAPSAKPRAELVPPNTGSSTCATHPQPHRPCQRLVKCPFQIMQENFKGKALPRASKAGGSSGHSSSPLKSPTASSFLFPMSRFSLQNTTSEEPGHPTPSRHLQSLSRRQS